jgi:nickel-type superoxide dismutase maturation protease
MTILSRFIISGHSMEPTLKTNDTVLVSFLPFLFSSPKVRDVVALKDPKDGKVLIKRITKIENKKYFIEGDNKQHSKDSREFGMIGKALIIGKVIYKMSHS